MIYNLICTVLMYVFYADTKKNEKHQKPNGLCVLRQNITDNVHIPVPLHPVALHFQAIGFRFSAIDAFSTITKMLDNLLHIQKPIEYLPRYDIKQPN